MATYPTTLPGPQRDGYGLKVTDPTIRTEMEAGHQRVRRRSVAKHKVVSCTFKFSAAEFQVFDDWFLSESGAASGAAWFDMPLDINGQIAQHTCRFGGMYEASLEGLRWRVSARIEVQAYA